MSDFPWVKFFPSDWLNGTRGLSLNEIGLYITLVSMMYERGGPLADGKDELRRICGVPANQFNKALDALLARGKLVETDAGLWNKRVEREASDRLARSLGGKAAAKSRWEKGKQKQGPVDADAMRGHYGGNAILEQNRYKLTTSEYVAARASSQGSPALGALPHRRALTEAERGERLKAALQRNLGANGKSEGREDELGASSLPTSEANTEVAA